MLTQPTEEELVAQVKKPGVRGAGGGGRKNFGWEIVGACCSCGVLLTAGAGWFDANSKSLICLGRCILPGSSATMRMARASGRSTARCFAQALDVPAWLVPAWQAKPCDIYVTSIPCCLQDKALATGTLHGTRRKRYRCSWRRVF